MMKKTHHPTTHRLNRRRHAADEAAAPVAERAETPGQSLEALRSPALGAAERGRAALGLQGLVGNAAVGQELARCACQEREQVNREISTPLPKDAEMRKDGAALLAVADVQVIVKPDRVSKNPRLKGAKTSFALAMKPPKATFKNNQLVALVSPKITVTIQTTYGPKADPEADSAYGKGTTDEDKQAGHTSLQFHEGSHGLDYIAFIQQNPPNLNATVGMDKADYQQSLNDFRKLMKSYAKNMDNFSKQRTDCVGTTIDQAGATTKPICE